MMGYNYPSQQSGLQDNKFAAQMYESAATNNGISLYDLNDQKMQYGTNTFNLQDFVQNTQNQGHSETTFQSKKDDFKVFHDIPASSLLLTNYDPFYSPLLSRLDSVFQQLNLDDGNEVCREKIICLMYASPAKYIPYSNLVSAQLSR